MICALCKEEKGKLIDSHFIPAAAYLHVRGGDEVANNSPVLINMSQGSAFQTDRQIKRPLLCGACEDLFSKCGERKMGELWATKSKFPLLDILDSDALISKGELFTTYDGRILDKDIVSAVFYFAISIFWRAHVWDWGRERDAYGKALGDFYEQKFRRFLFKGEKLENVLLLIDVCVNPSRSSMISFPASGRIGSDRVHSFSLLGIKFSMYVGQNISQTARAPFEMHNVQTMFISSDHANHPSFGKLAKKVQSRVVARGKLGVRYRK
jgi:hypothetical protein